VTLGQRLRRVEEAHVRGEAERLAQRYGVDVDEVLQTIREINQRVALGGIDAEIRHFAAEHGLSEEEVRVRYEGARREIEEEER